MKYFYLSIILSILICTSCTKKKNHDKSSIIVSREAIDHPMDTPDLSFFELKGPISCLLGNYYYGGNDDYDSIFFDKEGKLRAIYISCYQRRAVSVLAHEGVNFGYERDESGRFKTLLGIDGSYSFKWENGKVVERSYWAEGHTTIDSLIYDKKNGSLVRTIQICWGADERPDWTDTIDYKNLIIDQYGNWTKRREIHHMSDEYYDGYLIENAHVDTLYEQRRFFYF